MQERLKSSRYLNLPSFCKNKCYKTTKKANFNQDYSIDVEFSDGTNGIVKIQDSRFTKVFSPSKDITSFLKGFVKYGAITWNVGEYELDLAPDTMYEEIKNNNGIYICK